MNTVKYTCTNCDIYRLHNELYSKMRIDIYTYRKYVVLVLISMKFLQFLVFHEVLIYQYINELMKYRAPNINKYIVNLWKTLHIKKINKSYMAVIISNLCGISNCSECVLHTKPASRLSIQKSITPCIIF